MIITSKGELFHLISEDGLHKLVIDALFGPKMTKLMTREPKKLPVSITISISLKVHQTVFSKHVVLNDPQLIATLFKDWSTCIFNKGSKATVNSISITQTKTECTKMFFYYKVVNQCGVLQWPFEDLHF
jgi:hypothetical protein